MRSNHKKICAVLNYIEQLLILISAINGCVSISTFASLVGFVGSLVIKMSTCFDFEVKTNDKDSKFEVADHVRTLKYKIIFAKGPDWSEEVFVIKKVKNTVPWKCLIKYFNDEEYVGMFYEKRIEKDKSNGV